MSAKRVLFLILSAGLVGLAVGAGPPTRAATQSAAGWSTVFQRALPAPPASGRPAPALAQVECPILGPVVDIWVDAGANFSASVAYNSRHDEYLVVWWERQGENTWDIWARRVGGDGTPRSWFNVATGPGEKRWHPVVAYSQAQDSYLIVYQYLVPPVDYNVHAKLVSWDGGWIGNEFIIVDDADQQYVGDVAYNNVDDEYLVVYGNSWAGGLDDIAAKRLSASDGQLLSWRNIATGAGQSRSDPHVAWNEARNQYLIAYRYYGGAAPNELRGKISAPTMSMLSEEIVIRAAGYQLRWPGMAAGPDEYLVVWTEAASSTSDYVVLGRRVAGDGTPQGGSEGFQLGPFGGPAVHRSTPVSYGAGHGYLVAWEFNTGPAGYDVHGRYVLPGQNWAADRAFTVMDTPDTEEMPSVACAPSGACLVVWDTRDPAGVEDWDIFGRMVRPCRPAFLPLVVRDRGR